jgi:hypothetical protein
MEMMLSLLAVALLPVQDTDARLQSIVNRAVDLDPQVRAEAVSDAVMIQAELGRPLAESTKVPAMIVAALAGKREGAELLRLPDRQARIVACDLIPPSKELLPDILKLVEAKDVALRIAACRALGRVADPDLRKAVSSAMGHGMRRPGSESLI